MSNDILRFEKPPHRRDECKVLCARCGKMIPSSATRCPECGVHFKGEAYDFLHPSEQPVKIARGWMFAIAVLLLATFLLAILLLASIGLG